MSVSLPMELLAAFTSSELATNTPVAWLLHPPPEPIDSPPLERTGFAEVEARSSLHDENEECDTLVDAISEEEEGDGDDDNP